MSPVSNNRKLLGIMKFVRIECIYLLKRTGLEQHTVKPFLLGVLGLFLSDKLWGLHTVP